MLTPEELGALPEAVTRQFQALEETVLADIARRIRTAGTMTASAEWQLIRMLELGAAQDSLKRELSRRLGKSLAEVDALFQTAAERSLRFDRALFSAARLPEPGLEDPFFRQVLEAARAQTAQSLRNLTRTTAFRVGGRDLPAGDALRAVLDRTQWEVASGTLDQETVIRRSVQELADGGLRLVEYESGVVRTVEAAVRACVLTGLGQLTGQISLENARRLGTDIVEVTAHPGARPEHAGWQGKWYSLSGESPDYPSLRTVTGYGTVTGLKGVHCRHDFHPVIPGLSVPSYTAAELEALAHPKPVLWEGRQYDRYQASQRLRQIQRSIRGSKRRLTGYQAAGLEEAYTEESVRLRRLRRLERDFSAAMDLPLDPGRTQVPGWGRSQAARASQAARRAQT